jgi:hypothetical protein
MAVTGDEEDDVAIVRSALYRILYAYRYDEPDRLGDDRSPSGMGAAEDAVDFFSCPNTC